jgi:hypothetical protein
MLDARFIRNAVCVRYGQYNTQYNSNQHHDTQHNDIQTNNKNVTLSIKDNQYRNTQLGVLIC